MIMKVIAVTFTTADAWMTFAIAVLLLISVFLSLAETALTRMTVSKAQVISEKGGLGSKRILRLVAHPEEFLNVVLLVVLVCQLVQATLVGLVADNLFGPWGLVVWGIQMIWIPFWAAGVINGLSHWWGYRNTNTKDTSRNLIPWAIWIGGEELHNNHHADGANAKFSQKWYEFDLGWMYISILRFFKLATVR